MPNPSLLVLPSSVAQFYCPMLVLPSEMENKVTIETESSHPFTMTYRFTPLKQSLHAAAGSLKQMGRLAGTTIAIAIVWAGAVSAKDPFRTSNPRPISDNTQAAFEAFFKQGDYKAAADKLKNVEPNEPLALAMKDSLIYSDMLGEKDPAKRSALLEEFQSYGTQTRTAAEKMMSSDPLRGNLYTAVSHFFDGVYAFTKDGTVRGTPQALSALQQVTKYMDDAEAKSPDDPELNLLRGFLDVYTGVYLPFATPTKGLERLQKFAGPRYLADRGLAMGYLELNDYGKALTAVDQALTQAPNNPELFYLKAKILVKQGKDQESLPYFDKALSKQSQLPTGLVKEMSRAQRKAQERLANKSKS